MKAQRKYWSSKKGRISQAKGHKKYTIKNKEKRNAKTTVNNAINNGRMKSIQTKKCRDCKQQAKHYHHYKGYAKKHWLDVIPLCAFCHRKYHPGRQGFDRVPDKLGM